MKDFTKCAMVGIVGYFIGFYEMKYKVMKCIIKDMSERKTSSEEKETEE